MLTFSLGQQCSVLRPEYRCLVGTRRAVSAVNRKNTSPPPFTHSV